MKKLKIAGFDAHFSPNPIVKEWCDGFKLMGHDCDFYDFTEQSILSCLNKEYDLVIMVGPINHFDFQVFKVNSPNCRIIYFTDAWQPFLPYFQGLIDVIGTIHNEALGLKAACGQHGFRFESIPLCGNEHLFFPIECEKEWDVGFIGSLTHGNRDEAKYLYPILDNPKYKCFLGGMTYKEQGVPMIPYGETNVYRNRMKVSINFHCPTQKQRGIRWDGNQSIFNIALSGVLQICDHPIAKELFEGSIVVPDDKDWLDAVDYYVNHPEEGRVLAEKARKIALTSHSLGVRLRQLLEKTLHVPRLFNQSQITP